VCNLFGHGFAQCHRQFLDLHLEMSAVVVPLSLNFSHDVLRASLHLTRVENLLFSKGCASFEPQLAVCDLRVVAELPMGLDPTFLV
jgi:hypothetical protein